MATFIGLTINSITATTNVTIPLPAGTLAGHLIYMALAFSGSTGSIGGVGITGWTTETQLTASTTVVLARYWKIATSADITAGAAQVNWTTSRRCTFGLAAYSINPFDAKYLLNNAVTNGIGSATTPLVWSAATDLSKYPGTSHLEILVGATAVLTTYNNLSCPGFPAESPNLNTRGQKNQTSGPSLIWGDSVQDFPARQAGTQATRESGQSPSGVWVTSRQSFRDSQVASAVEVIPAYDQANTALEPSGSNQPTAAPVQTSPSGVPILDIPTGFSESFPSGSDTQNEPFPWLQNIGPSGVPSRAYEPGTDETITQNIIIDEGI